MRIPLLALLLLTPALYAQQTPSPAAASWWAQTTALANDGMGGRDTGTEAYERAAKYVAEQFRKAGLQPAGDNGTFFQRVPMHELDLDLTRSRLEVLHFDQPNGVGAEPERTSIKLVEEATLTPTPSMLNYTGGAVFLGYADTLPDPQTLGMARFGGAAVIFNGTPAGLSAADRTALLARRTRTIAAAGFTVILSIDNPTALEPFHWPAAYSRSVTLATSTPGPTSTRPAPVQIRISAEAAAKLFAHLPTHPYAALLADAEAGKPLPDFPLRDGLHLELASTAKEISSPNILAVFPGADPSLVPQYVAVSAHLDGYGFGTPVNGDRLYNGALDDAAYVATLIELADNLHRHSNRALLKASITPEADDPGALVISDAKAGIAAGLPRRSILFAIFTGEEKGLLGSAWFTQHPTVAADGIVADLNLDQLRPIFPLHILTMEGIGESTLGETARTIATQFHIELRPDHEPERNLFRRADNYNFVRIGVPIASFIFGYNPGTPEEAAYRDWYARRYHKPQDDLSTPIDWTAAVTFNEFFRALVLAVANEQKRPQWLPTSAYAPGAH